MDALRPQLLPGHDREAGRQETTEPGKSIPSLLSALHGEREEEDGEQKVVAMCSIE